MRSRQLRSCQLGSRKPTENLQRRLPVRELLVEKSLVKRLPVEKLPVGEIGRSPVGKSFIGELQANKRPDAEMAS